MYLVYNESNVPLGFLRHFHDVHDCVDFVNELSMDKIKEVAITSCQED